MIQYSEFLFPGNGKTGMGITRGTVMDKVSDEKDKDKDKDKHESAENLIICYIFEKLRIQGYQI